MGRRPQTTPTSLDTKTTSSTAPGTADTSTAASTSAVSAEPAAPSQPTRLTPQSTQSQRVRNTEETTLSNFRAWQLQTASGPQARATAQPLPTTGVVRPFSQTGGAETAAAFDRQVVAFQPGIDRRQPGGATTSRAVNNIVQFTRARPPSINTGNIQSAAQRAPVSFRPVASGSNTLRLNVSGRLGDLAINPQVLSSGSMNEGQANVLFAAIGRAQAVDKFLEHGGHLVFERSLATGGVAHYFPPGTGGPNGAFAEEYNRLLQMPNVGGAWNAPRDFEHPPSTVDRLEQIRDVAEQQAIDILGRASDQNGDPLIQAVPARGGIGDVGEVLRTTPAPGLQTPPNDLSAEWSDAVQTAVDHNQRGASLNPSYFVMPRIEDGTVTLESLHPSQVPTNNEQQLLDIGLSTDPQGLLAQGLTRQLEAEALRENGKSQDPAQASFLVVEGTGVDQTLVRYPAHALATAWREQENPGFDLAQAGLSADPNGQLAKANEAQHVSAAEAYNSDAAERRPATVALVEGLGMHAQSYAERPTVIREQLRSNALSEDDLKRVGLSTADNGLLSASLKNELGAINQHFNSTTLDHSPTRIAIVEGKGMDQEAVALRPSEVDRRVQNGQLTEADLANSGLSTRASGILDQGLKKERIEEIETDPSEEAEELTRIIGNPDGDSAPLVREAIEQGHGARLKRYVAANGTDGIGSFARTLLDGQLLGGGQPPIDGTRPVAAAAGEPQPSLDQVTAGFQADNFLRPIPNSTHDRRHVLLAAATNRQGEAMINAAETVYLEAAAESDLSPNFYRQGNLQTQLDAFRHRFHENLGGSKARVLRALQQDNLSVEELHAQVSQVMREEGVHSVEDKTFIEAQADLNDIRSSSSSPQEYQRKVRDLLDKAYTPPSDDVLKQQFSDTLTYLRALRNANPDLTTRQLLEDPDIGSQVKFPSQTELDEVRFGDGQTTDGLDPIFRSLQ